MLIVLVNTVHKIFLRSSLMCFRIPSTVFRHECLAEGHILRIHGDMAPRLGCMPDGRKIISSRTAADALDGACLSSRRAVFAFNSRVCDVQGAAFG